MELGLGDTQAKTLELSAVARRKRLFIFYKYDLMFVCTVIVLCLM
jgi:hypothetical protein